MFALLKVGRLSYLHFLLERTTVVVHTTIDQTPNAKNIDRLPFVYSLNLGDKLPSCSLSCGFQNYFFPRGQKPPSTNIELLGSSCSSCLGVHSVEVALV